MCACPFGTDFRSRRLTFPVVVVFFLSAILRHPSLLLRYSFLLAGDRLLWPTARARIRAGALSAYRQIAAMAQAAIAANFDQPLDVHIDFAAQVALNFIFAINHLTQTVDLFFSQIPYPRIRVNMRFRQDFAAGRQPNSVDIAQRNFHTLLTWNVNAGNSSHLSLQLRVQAILNNDSRLLALPLLVLGVFTTDHHHNTIASNHSTVFATRFHCGKYFHDSPPYDSQ